MSRSGKNIRLRIKRGLSCWIIKFPGQIVISDHTIQLIWMILLYCAMHGDLENLLILIQVAQVLA